MRYSSLVVAPISCSSPRASDGLSILAASIAPSAPPAPIIVWISSIKRSTLPACITSFIARFIRSSNSPRYLEPATIPDKSRVSTLLFCITSGIFPAAISCASPSTTAVLPTPGSPTRHGLFLVRLLNISTSLLISASLPITGSSFPSFAYFVRSLLYWSSTGVADLPPLLLRCIRYSFFALAASCPVADSTST